MIWLDRDLQWSGLASGKRGRPSLFSDAAIQFCLTIKALFGLALRQAMGMVESLLKLAGLSRLVPDYSTVCRRQKTLRFGSCIGQPHRGCTCWSIAPA